MKDLTMFDLATRYVGIKELAGEKDHPLVQWWLSLCGFGTDAHDEIAWCSAFVNGMAWELRLPRSKSAAARSWLAVGSAVPLVTAQVGYDIVVLRRGPDPQPGPEVIAAPGHVGIYAGMSEGLSRVHVLGGNQNDSVSVAEFDAARVLGVRRLA